MREILSQRGFSDEEIITLETRADYEEVRERVERMQTDRLLDQLETRTEETIETETQDLEARWERFKADIMALETSEEEEAPETLEEMRTRLEAEAIERAETIIREQAATRGPVAEFFADIAIDAQRDLRASAQAQETWNAFDRLISRFSRLFGVIWARIITAIAWVFLGTWAREIFSNMNQRIQEARNATFSEVTAPVAPEGWETPTPEVESWLENLNVTNFRYNLWLNTLIFFSDGSNLENNSYIRNIIFQDIKNLPLSEVVSLISNYQRKLEVFWEHINIPWFIEGLNTLLSSFASPQFLEVCELSLSWNRINNILAPNGVENRRLFQILWEQRAREIIRLSNVSWFELSSLTMYELSILYSESFPNFAYMQLASSLALWIDIVGTATEEFQQMVNNSVSGKIFNFLVSHGDGTIDGPLNPNYDSNFLSNVLAANLGISEGEMRAVIDFKNYILSTDFQNNTSLRLQWDTLDAFIRNLTYTRIIILYDILKWGRVEDINPLNFPLLILAISSIIWWNVGDNIQNTGLAEAYKWQFVRDRIIDFYGRSNLSQSERRAYEIYWEAFIYLGLQAWAERVYWVTRLSESITWISDGTMLWLSTLAMPAWGFIARQGIHRASPMLFRVGWWLRYLWWVWAIIYWGVLWYEYLYENGSETGRPAPDLTIRDNERYIGHQIDRDLGWAQTPEAQMEVIWRLQENTHEYMIGNEPITVITYPGDIPHAVYRGKIWTFQVLDQNKLAEDIEQYLINFIRGISENEVLHDNFAWTDGDKVYIWSRENPLYQFPINELFPPANNSTMGIETTRDMRWILRNFFDTNFPWHWIDLEWRELQYISLIHLPWRNNIFLWLVEVLTLPQNSSNS